MHPSKGIIALIAATVLLVWSAIFAPTFRYPFFWDDYHCIRNYTAAEVLATFHGWDDPDKMETPALRPMVTTLFALQGAAFGENVVLHRIFLTALMWCLLFAVGMLLAELRANLMQIALVFALFVFSRSFAAVNLWIILSSLVLAYMLMAAALWSFVRWIKDGRLLHFGFMTLAGVMAAFTREEAYVLCVAAVLVWISMPEHRASWRRAGLAAAALLGGNLCHVGLRRIFVPEAPAPKLTADSLQNFFLCIKSAWLPAGLKTFGAFDNTITNASIVFLLVLFAIFLCLSRPLKRRQALIACALGVVFCLPSLAVAHSYGLTMPALAFTTAIAIALTEVYARLRAHERFGGKLRYVFAGFVALGLTINLGGGLRRSYYVAESLHENCALKILFDATFVFDMTPRPTTVPAQRKAAERARLASFGINGAEDIQTMFRRCANYDAEYVANRPTRAAPFLPRYSYGAY